MKSALVVLGIFLAVGSLMAFLWALQFNHPTSLEKTCWNTGIALEAIGDSDGAHQNRMQSAELGIARERRRDFGRITAGTCGIFSALSFGLAACWRLFNRAGGTGKKF